MRRIKSLVALLAVAAILFMLPNSTLTASAEEGTTYVVKYMDDTKEWRYQPLSAFDDAQGHGPLSQLTGLLKDGDLVVVDNPSANASALDLGDVRLNNLTIVQTGGFTIVNVKEIENCYVLAGTSSAVNANITYAYVYDSVLCNFGGNVYRLTLNCTTEPVSTLGVTGTLGHFYAPSTTLPRTYFDYYNFAAGKFHMDNGGVTTSWDDFSREEPAATPTPAPQQPSGNTSGSASDYDDVPKTGESNLALWFLGAAVLSAVASFALAKKSH